MRSLPFVHLAVAALALAAAALAGVSGCSEAAPVEPKADDLAALYPSVAELYGADQGLYAGCGPNNSVCHNSKQYPDLSSLGSVVDHIGDPCNELVDRPEKIHDLCERTGDLVLAGDQRIEIAWVEPLEDGRWRVALASSPAAADAGSLVIERDDAAGTRLVAELHDLSVEIDAGDPRSLLVTLPPPNPDLEDEDPLPAMIALFAGAGVPADPASVQVGDPNRNGNFGARLGGRLIKPGDPEKSYILRRLTDPAAGPLMPLANCCYWRKEAVRALWCWIAGMEEDGSNALDPIDYASCPPGPPLDHLAYPELGEACQGAGMCPIQSTLPVSSDPTWANVYGNVMTRRCAGSGCHFDGDGAGLRLADEDAAYTSLVDGRIVVPGNPEGSVLFQRVTLACAPGEPCARMPRGLDPLPDPEIEAIRGWIAAGAPR